MKPLKNMKIIALDSLDKSGKATMTKLLGEYLELRGFKVMKSEFPRYDTPTGELIRQWLAKEWDVDNYTFEYIMAADKQAQQPWFDQLDNEGYDFLILDRYIGSQAAYSTSNNIEWDLITILQRHMRKPDIELFIDITPEESMRRKGKHNDGVNDRYEENIEVLIGVAKFLRKRQRNVKINGMRSIEEIFEDIKKCIDTFIDTNKSVDSIINSVDHVSSNILSDEAQDLLLQYQDVLVNGIIEEDKPGEN